MASKKDLLARIGKLGAKEFADNKNNLKHTQKELKEIIEIVRSENCFLNESSKASYDILCLFIWSKTPQGDVYWRDAFSRVKVSFNI